MSSEDEDTTMEDVVVDVDAPVREEEGADVVDGIRPPGGGPGGRGDNDNFRPHGRGGGGGGGAGGGGGDDDDDDDPYSKVRLGDVGGLDAQKKELTQSVLQAIKNEQELREWNFVPPKGIMFHGPPGTGKTLLARAFSNEVSDLVGRPVKVFIRKGGDFMSKWFGQSQDNVRKLFAEAVANQPSVIFIDEMDGVAPTRESDRMGEGHVSVVTALLSQMDNLPVGKVFVVAATNRLDAVDAAMLRPGRFDVHLEFHPPNAEERSAILGICTKAWPEGKRLLPGNAFLAELVEKTSGYSGADLEALSIQALQGAIKRHLGPSLDLNKAMHFHTLEVTNEDWMAAMTKMKKTSTEVYGSTLYSPDRPSLMDCGLVGDNVVEIGKRLKTVFEAMGTNVSLTKEADARFTPRTLLIVDQGRSSINDDIEKIILPAVFTAQEWNTPVYKIDQAGILQHHNVMQAKFISNVIHQASNCRKPCVLFIPRIDEFAAYFPDLMNSLTTLMEFRGKQVQVICTASCGPELIPESVMRIKAFNNVDTVQVTLPDPDARKNYFEDLFSKAFATPGAPMKEADRARHDRALNKAVRLTEGKSVTSIKRLFKAVHTNASSHYALPDKKRLSQDLEQLLQQYSINELNLK